MKLFEFVAKEDRKLDLADLDNAIQWLRARPFWPKAKDGARVEPRPETGRRLAKPDCSGNDEVEWRRNIQALRSLAGRLTRLKVRTTKMNALVADVIFRDQLEKLVVRPLKKLRRDLPNDGRTLSPYSKASLVGYEVQFGPPASENDSSVLLDQFWMAVFWSMIPGDGRRVCECGRELPSHTPTGRPSKKKQCETCKSRRWLKNLDPAVRREGWTFKQRKKREKL